MKVYDLQKDEFNNIRMYVADRIDELTVRDLEAFHRCEKTKGALIEMSMLWARMNSKEGIENDNSRGHKEADSDIRKSQFFGIA